VHSASSGKYVLVTAHQKRGKDGMDAAGVLPVFAGTACQDAWAPYDCYQDLAGHALCCAHLLRERGAVTDEYLDAMNALWYDQRPAYHGRFADFAGVDARPRPVQRPIPLVVGGHSARLPPDRRARPRLVRVRADPAAGRRVSGRARGRCRPRRAAR
jgi:hypothetical protein